MKVLLAHNFYQSSSPSGEDIVYRSEVDLLRNKGIDVVSYERSNDDLTQSNWRAALSAVWSRTAYDEVTDLIKKEKPDIAHFHNIWYLISPSAYQACRDAGVPVVQTLHNFRMFCANGLLLRNARVCEECVGTFPWRGAAYGCFRDSRPYSAVVAGADIYHKLKRTWSTAVDAYIALTEFGRQKFISCGLPGGRIFVKPNFLGEPTSPKYATGDYAIYLGRLSQEKGLDVLLDAAAHFRDTSSMSCNIKIVGDGSLREYLEKKVRAKHLNNIEFLGRKDFGQCMGLLSAASFLIVPSVCYENFPMAIREAFACGKPVITSRLGAMAEIVEDNKTGLLFNPGDSADLAEKMRWMMENEDACIEMGRNARTEFENKYTADQNFDILMNIYRMTIAGYTK